MLIYFLVAISICFSALAAYFWSLYSKYKIHLNIVKENHALLESSKLVLEQEKIALIQDNEKLSSEIKYQKQLIAEFEKLKQDSNETNKAVLFDLGKELSKQLIDLHKKENKESRELSENNIKKTGEKFNSEFERVVNLVGSLNKEVSQSRETVDIIKNSLLSPSGAGALAEITLENILRSSGLRSNLDYMMQYSTVDQESKVNLRPDAVVFLPSNKIMVVDSKASKFLVDEDSDPKSLAKTMSIHLKSLSSKNYAEIVKNSVENKISKDCSINIITLMFLPSEHAVEKIMEADSEFMNKAWNHNIFPVGPAGLMNMLSFAKFQISEQLVLHNNIQIIEEVKKLILSISSIAEHSTRLGNSIASSANNYDKFAASFNRNFLSKAKKISNMGIENSLKKDQQPLQRMQIVASKSELIEVEEENKIKEIAE